MMEIKEKEIRLSVLDTGILTGNKTASIAIEESKQLITKVEALGYYRYWVGEHHENHYSWTKPSTIIPYLAAHTSTIRLGSAAVLLGLYSPLQVAEEYRALSAMFPNRIDYGVCSAAPSCNDSRHALLGGELLSFKEVSSQFEDKLTEMHSYLHNTYPKGHRFEHGATPIIPAGDATWIMGSGIGSAILASKNSFAYCYSLFHKRSVQDPAVMSNYTKDFKPNFNRKKATTAIAISVICSEDMDKVLGQKSWIESVQSEFKVNIFGTPKNCIAQIKELCMSYNTREVVIYMMWQDYDTRLKAYEQLMDTLGEVKEVTAHSYITN